jgi:hypothetical protein
MKNYKSKTMIFDPHSEGNCKIIDVVRNEKGEIIKWDTKQTITK